MLVYQRVYIQINPIKPPFFLWFSYGFIYLSPLVAGRNPPQESQRFPPLFAAFRRCPWRIRSAPSLGRRQNGLAPAWTRPPMSSSRTTRKTGEKRLQPGELRAGVCHPKTGELWWKMRISPWKIGFVEGILLWNMVKNPWFKQQRWRIIEMLQENLISNCAERRFDPQI